MEIIEWIKNWVRDNNADERSIRGFWNYFNSYREEYPDIFNTDFPDYQSEYIETFIDKVSFSITNWPLEDYNHIVFDIRIHYKDRYIATYKIVYNLDGSVEDDSLKFD
ncbi:MAG: hypothetical protein DF221_00885 [Brevibacillus sp.]|jgi:hypothetical protein|nr:MAG: hypothetical protein DF221_00885 [Brevibacillus sp.]